jgi:conjugal transfer mating pair stabilization protein TraG
LQQEVQQQKHALHQNLTQKEQLIKSEKDILMNEKNLKLQEGRVNAQKNQQTSKTIHQPFEAKKLHQKGE